MTLLAFASGFLGFLLVVLLLSNYGQRKDRQAERIRKVSGTQEAEDELLRPLSQRFLAPFFFGILRGFSQLFPKNKASEKNAKLERELRMAGSTLSASEYTAMRMMVLMGCIGGVCLLAFLLKTQPMVKLLIVVFGLVLSILIPRYYLKGRVKTRQNGMKQQMPDIMDLLAVSVEAGLSFDAALFKISERAKGPLVEEFMTVYRHIQMGRPRKDALRELGERNEIQELKVFSGAIIQAEQLGISIKNVMRAQAQQIRIARRQAAEEKAMKAPIKMMIPLLLFIFPVVFIILMGPAVINIIETFRG